MSVRNVIHNEGHLIVDVKEAKGDFSIGGDLSVKGEIVNEVLKSSLDEIKTQLSTLRTANDLEDLDQQTQINILRSNQLAILDILNTLWDAVQPQSTD